MSDALDRVVPLDQLDDFEVAEGDPDVRGWKVLAADGRRIGEVDDLLIDRSAMKVRYLDVDLEDDIAGDDRHILVPIGYARLDEKDDHVFVDSFTSTDLNTMPVYDHGPISREYESTLRGHFDRSYQRGLAAVDTDFYAADLYDSDRFYSSRRGARGNPLA